MNRALPISMANLLLGACLAFGQSSGDAPSAPVTQTPRDILPNSPTEPGPLDGACGPVPNSGPGLLTAEMEYVLWTFPKRPEVPPVAVSNVLGTSDARFLLGTAEE